MINPKILKQVRKALGLTQQELADALGLSRVTINKMEKGKLKRGIPDEIGAKLMALRIQAGNEALVVKAMQTPVDTGYVNSNTNLWDNEEDES